MSIIPKHFVSLQDQGFKCNNYYYGDGGKKIGITDKFLKSIGITDDTMWIHSQMLAALHTIRNVMRDGDFGIIIKDAFRPAALYNEIVRCRRRLNLPVKELINQESMPHATGYAVDIVLATSFQGTHEVATRNQSRDGIDCCRVDYYKYSDDPTDQEFHRRQSLLIRAALDAGLELGPRREYWHFQMPCALYPETPRY